MAEAGEPLTERELEVVRLLSTGAGNKEIAAQLYLSPNTVKVHLRNIFTKLEAQSRVEVTMIAVRNGWVVPAAEPAAEPAAGPAAGPAAQAAGEQATAPANGKPADTASQSAPATTPVETTDLPRAVAHAPSGASVIDAEPLAAANVARAITDEQPPHPADSPSEAPASVTAPANPAGERAIPRAVAPVPVAPNPQPLPPLPLWRRALIVATLLLIAAGSLASLPALGSNARPDADGTDLVDNNTLTGDLLAPGEATRWYLRGALPAARARSAAAAVGGLIYLIGGETNQTASGDVLVFDPRNNTWAPLDAPKPTPAWNAPAVAVGALIYVAGGTTANGVATNRLEALDTTANVWRSLRPLPAPMTGHSMAALGGKLYVFGDKSSNPGTVDSFAYDIAGDTWHPIAPMPTPRSLTGAAAFDDRIYVIGGYDEGREFATCEVYWPARDAWSTCAPMQISRGGPGIARVGNSLYAVGGGWAGFVGFNERYDPQTDRWTSIETPLIGDWRSVAIAAQPTEFYVIGGYSNGRRLAFTYVYEVFTNRTFLPAFQASPDQP